VRRAFLYGGVRSSQAKSRKEGRKEERNVEEACERGRAAKLM